MSDPDSPIATTVLGNEGDFRSKVREFDEVALTAEERASPHMAVESLQGRRIRISLPRGEQHELQDGDVLLVNEDQDWALVVRAADEDLFVLRPETALDWGIAGYQLGNLHRPVRFMPETMLTPYDPMVASVLNDLGIPYSRNNTPFVGRRVGSHTGHSH
jgi:urease accessory protein